jgi:glutathione S-transferase
MSDLILYYAVPSRGITVHWMLEEIGEPYETRLLSIDDNEHKTPEFLAINPMGRVPALVHGDVIVTETAAICAYLAESFPAAGLNVPLTSPDRGAYLRWLFFAPVTAETSMLWKSLGEVTTERDYKPFAELTDVADTLAGAVRDREFIVDGHFTAADVMIGSVIMWGTRLIPVLPPLPELTDYWSRMEQRDAWQRSFGEDQALMADRVP